MHFLFQIIRKGVDVPFPVLISGSSAASMNGVYKLTREICDGKVVYEKDGGGMWIEYNQHYKKWLVRPTADRNSNKSDARSAVTDEEILSSKVTGWTEEKNGKSALSSMVYDNCIGNHILIYFK